MSGGSTGRALTGEDIDASPELLQARRRPASPHRVAARPVRPAPLGRAAPASARTRAARDGWTPRSTPRSPRAAREPREDLLSRLVARESDDQLVQATFKQWLGADQLMWHLHLGPAPAGDPPGGRGALARVARRRRTSTRSAWSRRRCGSTRRSGASSARSPRTTPLGGPRDPRRRHDRDEPVLHAPRRDGLGGPAALRSRALGTARSDRRTVAYFPFSAGPYECHARGLAMQEAS